jgi:hypothetical protein
MPSVCGGNRSLGWIDECGKKVLEKAKLQVTVIWTVMVVVGGQGRGSPSEMLRS